MKKAKKEISGKRITIIFISVFLAFILALIGTLGTITLIREKNAIVVLDGATIDKGVASFLVSRYRAERYPDEVAKAGYDVNSDGFWDSKIGDIPAKEHFEISANTYLRGLLAESYIFDTYSSLTNKEKAEIEKEVNWLLDYHAGGDVEKFNELSAVYGFEFDDLEPAATILYKARCAFAALYGEDGSRISSDTAAAEAYLNEYAHVYILMVRENTKLENGENVFLNTEEKNERETLLSKIEAAMEAYRTGGDGEMTKASFEKWISESHDSQNDFTTKGFYFHENAEMTIEFDEGDEQNPGMPGVAKKAMEMALNTFDEVTTTITVRIDGNDYTDTVHCFLYRTAPNSGAYQDSVLADVWFYDFYTDLAVYIYQSQLTNFLDNVKNGGSEEEFDYASIPVNELIVMR